MSRKKIENTIDGDDYRLTQLGSETISDLGFAMVEATAKGGNGIAATMKVMRKTLADATEVRIAGKWAPLNSLSEWWDERPRAHGHWFAWATEVGGLPDFFLGTIRIIPPQWLKALSFIFQRGLPGGSTDSSTAPGSESPPEPSSSETGRPST